MTENKLPSYEECVAKYPVTYSKQPFDITEDGSGVFNISREIKGSLVIPEGIKVVSFNGEYRNDDLTAFILPDSVERIIGFFNGFYCEALEFVRLSKNLEIIPELLFRCCRHIKNLIIPEAVREIQKEAFEFVPLNELHLPESVEYIGPKAFTGLDIEELIIPSNVRVICFEAFSSCKKLTKLIIQNKETVIQKDAFKGCELLEIDLDKLYKDHSIGNRIIGEDKVVYSENGEELLYMPTYYSGVFRLKEGTKKLIDSRGLGDCYGITELFLPASFAENARNLTLPPNVKKVQYPKLISGSKWEDGEISLRISEKDIEEVILPDNVTNLEILFAKFKSFVVPEGVVYLKLAGLKELEEISLSSPLRSLELNDLKELSNLKLPNSLEKVSIRSLDKLEKIVIPDEVVDLEIKYCESLKTFNIPPKLEEIKKEAFIGNVVLEEIFIPNTVSKISGNAFEGCSNLKKIKIQGKPKPKISKSAFEGCPGWPIKK